MSYVIAAPCIGHKDLSCILVCPAEAIAGMPSDPQLYIDPDLCIQCGLCTTVCPAGAIYPEEDLPERWQKYAKVNHDFFHSFN